jgi:hypothetical protein
VDDTVGLFYGGSFTTLQSTASAVWDSGYKAVHHLPDGTTLGVNDSSINANNGALSGAPVAAAGRLGGGVSVSTNNWIQLGTTGFPSGAGALTLEAWFKPSALPAGYGIVLNIGDVGLSNKAALIYSHGSSFGAGGTGAAIEIASALSTGNWYHAALTYNGAQQRAFLNGAEITGSPTAQTFNLVRLANHEGIGHDGYGDYFSGVIDEVRISTVARSGDWILTEYRNQSAPATYLSLGPGITASQGQVRHSVR